MWMCESLVPPHSLTRIRALYVAPEGSSRVQTEGADWAFSVKDPERRAAIVTLQRAAIVTFGPQKYFWGSFPIAILTCTAAELTFLSLWK